MNPALLSFRRMRIPASVLLASLLALGSGFAVAQPTAAVTAPAAAFELTQDVSYRYTGGFGREFEVGVLAGRFHLEAATKEGRYFLAERPSVWWKAGASYLLLKKAGLWVPSDPASEVRIYFYNRAGHEAAKTFEELHALARGPARPSDAAMHDDRWIPPGIALVDLILATADTGAQLHPAPTSASFSADVRAHLGPQPAP